MTEERELKELFATIVAGGPADQLDVDRAVSVGNQRRRRRQAASVASLAALVLALAGFVATLGLTRARVLPVEVPVPTPSASASPAPSQRAIVTAQDWLDALVQSMPYRDQLRDPRVIALDPDPSGALRGASSVHADFHYGSGPRWTRLFVSATSKPYSGWKSGTPREFLLKECRSKDVVSCEPLWDSPKGPVVVQHRAHSVVALNLRPSGVLISVTSTDSDQDGGRVDANGTELPGLSFGPPGMAEDLDRLVTTALDTPEPLLAQKLNEPEVWAPTPVATSNVVTMSPGKSLELGSGATITSLTQEQVCVAVPGGRPPRCDPSGVGGQRFVSKLLVPFAGAERGAVIVGRYSLADVDVKAIVVTIGGESRTATLVKVGPKDEHLGYYVIWPALGSPSGASAATVEVFGHDGRLMAHNVAS